MDPSVESQNKVRSKIQNKDNGTDRKVYNVTSFFILSEKNKYIVYRTVKQHQIDKIQLPKKTA